jgi:hypothetical protein
MYVCLVKFWEEKGWGIPFRANFPEHFVFGSPRLSSGSEAREIGRQLQLQIIIYVLCCAALCCVVSRGRQTDIAGLKRVERSGGGGQSGMKFYVITVLYTIL